MKTWFTEKLEGQGLVEYALLLMLIALAVVASVGFLGVAVEGYYQRVIAVL